MATMIRFGAGSLLGAAAAFPDFAPLSLALLGLAVGAFIWSDGPEGIVRMFRRATT